MEHKEWGKLIDVAAQAAKAGTGAGLLITGVAGVAGAKLIEEGVVGAVKAATAHSSSGSILPTEKIKEIQKKREEGKVYLAQCPHCAKWVCLDCWNTEQEVCIKCVR